MKKLLMGNEAIAWGAIYAGVNLVTGYPGTPSTEVLETIAKNNPGSIYVEWSVNEKAAMEIAAGGSYAGGRVLVTMKQMGLNVAADPLLSLSYVGTNGGMVVLAADDPGPISSQTEQDTRHFAQYANLPVLDPASPEEAYRMVPYAFELSEAWRLPVILRPTTRVCHGCATVELPDTPPLPHPVAGFNKDPKWVIFPSLSYKNHLRLESIQKEIGAQLAASSFNTLTGTGCLGVVASGISYSYAKEAIDNLAAPVQLLKIGTPYPTPEKLLVDFLNTVDKILVLEELDPVLEETLLLLCGKYHLAAEIYGKGTGHLPNAGEYTYEIALAAITAFAGLPLPAAITTDAPALPGRPPSLCAGCPHRAAFYAVKTALKGQKAVFTGDIGCYTLGNGKPLDMVDTCLCMGAGVTIAQGLKRIEPDTHHIAFIGDSTFFHTGIPGMINSIYNGTKITIAVLDNSTTAMTGHQPHPGTGKTMMGTQSHPGDIAAIAKACGAGFVTTVDPLQLEEAVAVTKEAVEHPGISVIIFRAPCIALFKAPKTYCVNENCTGCRRCIKEIGCPAMYQTETGVGIDTSLCYGCDLCRQVCPFDAITGSETETKGGGEA